MKILYQWIKNFFFVIVKAFTSQQTKNIFLQDCLGEGFRGPDLPCSAQLQF